jgi:dipeptidase
MKKMFFYFLGCFLSFISMGFACTTFLITKKATKDGSLLVGHTDDNDLGDERMVYIPAKDHPANAKRPIYVQKTKYPRLVAPRAEAYNVGDVQDKPVGYIDEAAHTYAYFEGNYGIMNEHMLSLGECTNSTNFYFDFDKDKRILNITTLSQIALERCKKAKDAVLLMGSLAEKYGYFDFGETLLVADTEEGWIFEITCTPDGTSALWVAKKVPDGEVFVAANQFRIREIDQNDKDILYSSNLFSIAEKQKWWDPNGKKTLDWVECVCPGEFDHPYYSLRRVWSVFNRVNKSLNLNPYVEGPFTKAYPFSIKPEKLLSLQDAMALFRDHYEGTKFDQRNGLAAGPYGLVNRYLGEYDVTDFPNKRKEPLDGAWERPISVYYVGYYYINQIRDWLPHAIGGVTWIGYDTPSNTCYMPFYVGVNNLPSCVQNGSAQVYDEKFVFWPFNITSNWISLWYQKAIDDVVAKQKEIEQAEFLLQKQVDEKALALYQKNPEDAKKFLTKVCEDNVLEIMQKWWSFNHYLMEKYNSGFINKPKASQKMGYNKTWRDQVGYKNGPTSYSEK